jgi:hypothetical protein
MVFCREDIIDGSARLRAPRLFLPRTGRRGLSEMERLIRPLRRCLPAAGRLAVNDSARGTQGQLVEGTVEVQVDEFRGTVQKNLIPRIPTYTFAAQRRQGPMAARFKSTVRGGGYFRGNLLPVHLKRNMLLPGPESHQ